MKTKQDYDAPALPTWILEIIPEEEEGSIGGGSIWRPGKYLDSEDWRPGKYLDSEDVWRPGKY